jgi:2-keto-4-pentenoate hydratase/2-oxohepta-3-ene-1,7-dioic acid hydratase in catechol pathway
MIFGIRALIADISTGMTGDLIATGTPVGVVVEIEKIGRLWNRVIAAR